MGICAGAGSGTTNRDKNASASLSSKQRFNLKGSKEEKGDGKTEIQIENWKETAKQWKENTPVTWWPCAPSQILALTLSAKD